MLTYGDMVTGRTDKLNLHPNIAARNPEIDAAVWPHLPRWSLLLDCQNGSRDRIGRNNAINGGIGIAASSPR